MLSFLGVKYSENLISKAIVVTVIIMAKDIVCGGEVKEEGCDWTAEFNGKKYYFDVAGCQTSFEMNPGHYIAHPHPDYR